MKLNVINIEGKKINDIDVSDKIFSLEPNNDVIQSLIDWQLNHFKPRTAKTKQRNQVIGSTKKIYAQKGTGGARHSSRKAPIFVGGGIAHGPKGKVYKIKKINKKMKKIGLFHLLSQKNKIKKTKIFNNFLIKSNLTNSLIISDKNSKKNIIKSARNIPNLKIVDELGANAYDILKYKNIIFTTSSIKLFQERTEKWRDFIIWIQ